MAHRRHARHGFNEVSTPPPPPPSSGGDRPDASNTGVPDGTVLTQVGSRDATVRTNSNGSQGTVRIRVGIGPVGGFTDYTRGRPLLAGESPPANWPFQSMPTIIENKEIWGVLQLDGGRDGTRTSATASCSGGVVTVVSNAHGLTTGQGISVTNAAPYQYQGRHFITRIDANTFQYTISTSSLAPATDFLWRIPVHDVWIRNCLIHSGGTTTSGAQWGYDYGVKSSDGCYNIVVDDCTFLGGGPQGGSRAWGQGALGFDGLTVRRCDISGGEDGVRCGTTIEIKDSYFHDAWNYDVSHTDNTQSTGGSDIWIHGNTMEAPFLAPNAACLLKPDRGPIKNVLIEDNYMDGGQYSMWVTTQCPSVNNANLSVATLTYDTTGVLNARPNGSIAESLSNITIRNNRFGRNYNIGPRFASTPQNACTPNNPLDLRPLIVWQNNVYDDNDEVINL